jgi:hypothetical protein
MSKKERAAALQEKAQRAKEEDERVRPGCFFGGKEGAVKRGEWAVKRGVGRSNVGWVVLSG